MSTPTINKKHAAPEIKSEIKPERSEAHQTRFNKAKFWVVCCEETKVTRQISEAVTAWHLPEVRSLSTASPLTHQIAHPISSQQPLGEAIAKANYAIFITSCQQHSSQIKVSPLSLDRLNSSASNTPAGLLSAIHHLHGQSPHSWWLQLPTVEVRAQRVQPVSTQESVAQALNQIGIFVRNYQLAMPYGEDCAIASAVVNSPLKASATQVFPKKPVVLSHYRRI